ncbi:MAG TPA: hypothetical protein PLN96_05915 [Zoogloea sp.]|uniref:hypothetical protein n=1 Tax=Zoogloea sp. TaxID=49181 RepID=UPI002CD09923|nr:hypothetical protein [Zoogloea sp.]HMV17239.1 hypothetical protein [Rhodocyclaceae bacterium]HMV62579.1 hypothetical protein [Rhodocyclaceae bacterium]HMW51076.1 hypothetical protein [Rhodocyclaceae bacterium]HMY49521.1 hypothetical protein [Rhodocyclaceae bacterium]HMZ75706.1 hypothetical protein [Rhodocyclaceae bacterium]
MNLLNKSGVFDNIADLKLQVGVKPSAALPQVEKLSTQQAFLTLEPQTQAIAAFAVAAQAVESSAASAAARPADPIAIGTIAQTTQSLGTIRQFDVVQNYYSTALENLTALRRIAIALGEDGKPTLDTTTTLLARVRRFLIDQLGSEDALNARLGQHGIAAFSNLFTTLPPKIGATFTDADSKSATHNAHSALFHHGAVITDDIRGIEALRAVLVALRQDHQNQLAALQDQLATVETQLPEAAARLDTLNHTRLEALDDYAAAQHTLAEHWDAVAQAYAERRRVIDSHRGLFYVKQRETPVTVTLPDPQDLRFTSPDDIVPGVPDREIPLADDLAPFMEVVLDIPVADWAVLSGLAHLLPSRPRLELMVATRLQKVALRQKIGLPVATARLQGLAFQNRGLLDDIALRPFAASAMLDLQRQGHAILALDDLLASPVPLLREPARVLHRRLDAAAGGLLDLLRPIAPSLRLAWAAAAEADTLPVERPERWPGIAQAEAADLNGLRTFGELVAWWFRQLDSDASAASRTAMRNFVRACVMLATGDNPDEILQGHVSSPPRRFRIGEVMRLELNREPRPGALLQLLDDAQRLVGTLRVDDHDNGQTVASIVRVLDDSLGVNRPLTTAFRVTGSRNP